MINPEDNIIDYVDDYVHGLLSPEDAELVERYCRDSRLGAVALEEARRRLEAIGAVAPSEASEELIQRTLEKIGTKDRARNRLRKYVAGTVLCATAVSILIIGSVQVHYNRISASPYDLRLLGQSELAAQSGASLRVAMYNRTTGRPMAGVPVQIELADASAGRKITLAGFTTDDRGAGSPRFELPDWEDGQYELRVSARLPDATESLVRPINLKRTWRVMLSTDKPVYQPGQTIRLRSLALKKPDLKPISGRDVTFTVTDPKGNVIFKRKDLTSKFGIASADCPLATEIIEGDYRIECRVGQTASDRTVTVQKYVLPKFKLDLTLDKPFYAPGESVSGTLQADYFFGKPVAGAGVEIEVRGADVTSSQIAAIGRKTDDAGRAQFDFRLPDGMIGREQDDRNARFMLVATVTDTAGQTYSKGVSRIVSADPIRVEVIPESGRLVRSQANTVYVFTGYPDGRPAATRLVMQDLDQQIETDKQGVASFELTPESETIQLTVKASDDEGRVGRKTVRLTCGQSQSDFLVRTDKAVYDGGQTMNLVALGGGIEPVFVDLIKDGQTMLTQTIAIKDGRGEYAFDLPPDIFGPIKVCAYRFGGDGLAVRKSRLIYVRQAGQIGIEATLDQEEYRPGTTASLKLRLTDPQGNPVPGAIGLKGVDEAVYAVLGQQAGMEKTFFLLEQELLEPVYVIYPGWSPELFSELPIAQRDRLEQALFSRTVSQAEGSYALPEIFSPNANRSDLAPPVTAAGQDESPFTLAAATFPEKAVAVDWNRRAGLARVRTAWSILFGTLILTGVVAFGTFYPRQFLITAGVCAGGIALIVILLVLLVFMLVVAAGCGSAEHGDPAASAPLAADAAAGEAETAEEPPSEGPPSADDSAGAPRVRQWFPETLLWRPELITDENGEVSLDVALADSITTWRLSASAVSAGGQLGGAEFPIKVFQPFFVDLDLPVALTRNDEVGVPVVVYNYLDEPQTVRLALKEADWFRLLDADSASEDDNNNDNNDGVLELELKPGEVRSLNFPLKVLRVGDHNLEVTATGSGIADAVRRRIEVMPDGRRVEEVTSGTLLGPLDVSLRVPEEAIEGSVRAIVKLYPSSFSQLVEGLDAIFQMPGGCFEQTSSTTYPNVLALDYLRRTGKSVPQVEAKARQYVHVGYQRLVSFEVEGGGFDWFGNPPANRTLTAYGLMEFEDMSRVHDVDPRLIERTRGWLLDQRNPNGSWSNERGMLNDGLAGSVNRGGDADLASTAYIGWAVFANGKAAGQAGPTLSFLVSHSPDSIDDPYLLALTANAIAAIDPKHGNLGAYLARLDGIKQTSDDRKRVWWGQPPGGQTTFYGSGRAGDIETTALSTLALLTSSQYSATVRGALAWLVEQKDGCGTWHSTQATVLSLRAILAGTGAALGADEERRIDIALEDQIVRQIVIPPDQSDVMQQIDLSSLLVPAGQNRLVVTDRTNATTGYQVTFRYHVEEPFQEPSQEEKEPLSIELAYDRERLSVDDTVAVVATVTNNMNQPAPMVILDLPIPGGFAIDPGELAELVGSQTIAKYQITARKAIVYLRRLAPGQTLELPYRLRATMPVKVAVPAAQAYEYYNPDKRGQGGATRLEVAFEI